MSLITLRVSLNGLKPILPIVNRINPIESIAALQIRNYAARKGTRERKEKKKVKAEIKKVGFIPHNQRDKAKLLASRPPRKFDDSWKRIPTDNVYNQKYFQAKLYPFIEAVQCHRETHHPDMYNVPEANLHVTIELYMQGDKPTRFVDNFARIVGIPHKFDHGEERSVIAFAKDAASQAAAQEAGAQLAGGADLIKQIQNGQFTLTDFKFIVAHPDILAELVQLRGLMKRRFPNPKQGTLDVDLPSMVNRFLYGINYSAKKDEYEQDFGSVETIIGRLDMEPTALEENFACLIRDIYTMKPKREGHFISRCLFWSPPSPEKLTVDYKKYLETKACDSKDKEEDEDEQQGERVAL